MPEEADFDFPIVELENDSPQLVGKPGLYDFLMPVGSTGIVFVAALQGILQSWGPVFSPAVQKAAYLRAASTLAQWGIVSGDTFAFLAQGAQLDQAGVAARYNVPLATVQAWYAGTIPVPPITWWCLAHFVGSLDGRSISDFALPPGDLRPRLIRVFPNVPTPNTPGPPPAPICPPPPPLC